MTIAGETKTRTGPSSGGERPARVEYEADLYGWALQQATLLRGGRLDLIDAENLAGEILDVVHDLEDRLRTDLSRVIQHLLKWDLQPDRRSRRWSLSISEHRRRVDRHLKRGPRLRARLIEILAEAYESGRGYALDDTGLPQHAVPRICPYTWDIIMSRPIEGPEPS